MAVSPHWTTPYKKLAVGRMKKVHKPNGTWAPEKKIEVVTKWLALGSLKQVAADTGVDYGLIRKWRTQSWWSEIEAEVRASRHMQVDNKLSRIVDKSLALLQDRLENGDFVLNQKTGEVMRKPISIRDANKVAVDMLTRQVAQQKLEVEVKDTNQKQTIQDQLKMLAEEFSKFNGKAPIQVIDITPAVPQIEEEYEDAVYEEWQEGLQEGSGEVYVEAGSDCEAGEAEPSTGGNGTGRESP